MRSSRSANPTGRATRTITNTKVGPLSPITEGREAPWIANSDSPMRARRDVNGTRRLSTTAGDLELGILGLGVASSDRCWN